MSAIAHRPLALQQERVRPRRDIVRHKQLEHAGRLVLLQRLVLDLHILRRVHKREGDWLLKARRPTKLNRNQHLPTLVHFELALPIHGDLKHRRLLQHRQPQAACDTRLRRQLLTAIPDDRAAPRFADDILHGRRPGGNLLRHSRIRRRQLRFRRGLRIGGSLQFFVRLGERRFRIRLGLFQRFVVLIFRQRFDRFRQVVRRRFHHGGRIGNWLVERGNRRLGRFGSRFRIDHRLDRRRTVDPGLADQLDQPRELRRIGRR